MRCSQKNDDENQTVTAQINPIKFADNGQGYRHVGLLRRSFKCGIFKHIQDISVSSLLGTMKMTSLLGKRKMNWTIINTNFRRCPPFQRCLTFKLV